MKPPSTRNSFPTTAIKNFILISLTTLLHTAFQKAAYLSPNDWEISSSYDNYGYWLITLTGSQYTKLSRDDRQILFTKLIEEAPDQFIYPEKKDNSTYLLPKLRIVENIQNYRRNQILFYFNIPESLDNGMELKLGLQNGVEGDTVTSSRRNLITEFSADTQYKIWKLPSQWVTNANWRRLVFDAFRYVRSFTTLIKVYLVFVRPALNPVHKLPIAWFASTILSVQVIYNIIYICGNFRGVIDEAHAGVYLANNWIFGMDIRGSSLSPEFYTRSTGLFMNKYTIFGYTPNPLLTTMTEVMIGIFMILFPWFAMAMNNKRLSRLSKEMKTGFVLGSSLPLMTNSIACAFNVVYIASWDWFSLASFCASILIISLLFFEIWKLTMPDQRYSFYFNNEEGILSLDCHKNAKVPFTLK